MNDWGAFGFFVAIVVSPIVIFFIKYDIDIFSSKLLFFGFYSSIAAFLFYWIYFKKIDWLTNKINKLGDKYHI